MQPQAKRPDLVRAQWEKRARAGGEKLSGVLFHGFSEYANLAMHMWHEWVVAENFLREMSEHSLLLDLGCGYGRLTQVVGHHRPDIAVVGQDMSLSYCGLFRKQRDACVCASSELLPFMPGSFDGVMAVTCLMYSPRNKISAVMEGLRSTLKPGGVMLMLDPALGLQRIIATLRGSRHRSPTGGQGFARIEYERIAADAGFRVIASGGNPSLSLALLTPGIATSSSTFARRVVNAGVRADCRGGGYSPLALHRWILVAREG